MLTDLAWEWFYTFVCNSNMSIQIRLVCVCYWTYCTRIGFWLVVVFQVSLQVLFMLERFSALFTRIYQGCVVSIFVAPQGRDLRKRFWTHVTFVGFFSCMCSLMNLKIIMFNDFYYSTFLNYKHLDILVLSLNESLCLDEQRNLFPHLNSLEAPFH